MSVQTSKCYSMEDYKKLKSHCKDCPVFQSLLIEDDCGYPTGIANSDVVEERCLKCNKCPLSKDIAT